MITARQLVTIVHYAQRVPSVENLRSHGSDASLFGRDFLKMRTIGVTQSLSSGEKRPLRCERALKLNSVDIPTENDLGPSRSR